MSTVIPDLWPSEIVPAPGNPPIAILRRQGLNLGRRTNNFVYGEVRGRSLEHGRKIELSFDIVAPLVGYSETILRANHDVFQPYPVVLVESNLTKTTSHFETKTASNESEFVKQLGEFLKRPQILELIQALLTQSNTAPADDEFN